MIIRRGRTNLAPARVGLKYFPRFSLETLWFEVICFQFRSVTLGVGFVRLKQCGGLTKLFR
jgi:hypothetical protein